MPNTLYYCDNLQVLREHLADESVDLVYLDPPFKSNASYNVPGQSRLNRPQVWDSGSLGSDESRKSFDLYVL